MRWLLVTLAACVPDGAPPLHNHAGVIGATCAADPDCVDGLTCMTGDFFDYTNLATPDGYCTRACSDDSECNGNSCIAGGTGTKYCAAACTDGSGCRDQYACWKPGLCEPLSFLNCDASVAACATGNSAPGGCIRYALGSGTTGVCRARCTVGNSICDADFTCLFFNETPDPFTGTACWPVLTTQTPEGSACMFIDECVKGDECVNKVCRRLCNPKQSLNCPAGQLCQDVYNQLSSTDPVGACL